MVRDLFQFCFIQPFGSYLSRKLDIQGTRITGRKRKSPLAEGNETECLTSRCGINKDLTIRTKTTASTGPKRIPKPKPAVIVEAASPEVAEILSTMKKKRTMKRVKGNGSLASTYTVESMLENWSESTSVSRWIFLTQRLSVGRRTHSFLRSMCQKRKVRVC